MDQIGSVILRAVLAAAAAYTVGVALLGLALGVWLGRLAERVRTGRGTREGVDGPSALTGSASHDPSVAEPQAVLVALEREFYRRHSGPWRFT